MSTHNLHLEPNAIRGKRMSIDDKISNFVDASIECGFAGRDYLTRKETYEVCKISGLVYPRWLAKDPDRRIGRGKFSFPELKEAGSGTVKTEVVVDDLSEIGNEVVVDDMPEEQVSIPVMTSNAIPTITSEDMVALSNL